MEKPKYIFMMIIFFLRRIFKWKKWNMKQYDRKGNIVHEMKEGKGYIWENSSSGYLYNIIFEGEYLNGLRNGKGKEYYCLNKSKFEGEYLTGLRNGKGKEYYLNGKLKFEVEYLYGKKWNIKEYDLIILLYMNWKMEKVL